MAPSEEEMQQVWDLIGSLMERYLRLRPIWQVAAGAFIEGFETGALKRVRRGAVSERFHRGPTGCAAFEATHDHRDNADPGLSAPPQGIAY